MRRFHRIVSAAVLVAGLFGVGEALAQPVVVDGNMWLSSTPESRKAFLVGAANMIGMETAYAKKKGIAPPPIGEMAAKAVEGLTLEQIMDRITQWYEANPQRHDVPVMGVIWIDLIKPTVANP
jgi:hypothetical protein